MLWEIIKLPSKVITLSVMNEGVESIMAPHSLPFKKKQNKKRLEFRKDRRKRRFDRRKCVRDGIVVSLSTLNNRRTRGDRRQVK